MDGRGFGEYRAARVAGRLLRWVSDGAASVPLLAAPSHRIYWPWLRRDVGGPPGELASQVRLSWLGHLSIKDYDTDGTAVPEPNTSPDATPPIPPNSTEQPKRKRRWLMPLLVGFFAFFLGVGAGGAGGESELDQRQADLDAGETAVAEQDQAVEPAPPAEPAGECHPSYEVLQS
jgi:hypothetical protein